MRNRGYVVRRAGGPGRRRADGRSTSSAPDGSAPRRPSGAPASRRGRCGWTAPSATAGQMAPRRAAAHLGAASLGRAGCAGLHRGAVRGRGPARRREAPGASHAARAAGLFLESTLLAVVRGRDPGAVAGAPAGARHLRRGALRPDPGGAVGAAARRMRDRRVRKVYRALCSGHPLRDAFAVEAPIGEVPYPPTGTLHAAVAGRAAVAEPGPGPGAAAGASRPRRSSRWRSRPDARTESASTSPSPATRSWAIPLFGAGRAAHPGRPAVPGDPGYHLHAFRLELDHPPDRGAGGGGVRPAAGAAGRRARTQWPSIGAIR